MAERADLLPGLVVASYGRHFLVETPDGKRLTCHPRGKKSKAVVGDQVLWQGTHDEGTIEKIKPLVALNKSDLVEPFAKAWARLLPYRTMGYGVLPLSLRLSSPTDSAELLGHLQGKTTLVLGPSGAGKSTLINLLVPGALVVTGEISQALNSGKHTTTSTTLYWVDAGRTTALIDSPGFQEFGLNHIEPTRLAGCMPDLQPHIGHCKFYNCTHLHEPGCAVIAAIESPDSPHPVGKRRYQIYGELFAELSQPQRY